MAMTAACRGALVAAWLAAAGAHPAYANDSSASLDAGGLHLSYNGNIVLESEALAIGRDQVRVVYHFHNSSAHDIGTLVAFPLPVMEIGEAGNYVLQGADPINIMDFRATVDGRRMEPSVQVRATRFGVDVTDMLKRYDIPLTMRGGDNAYAHLDALPDGAKRELERHGVVDWSSIFGAGNRASANAHWDTSIAYYWFQTFPAGRTIEVTHQYRPVPRHFFFGEEELNSVRWKKTYCMDPAFDRAARALIRKTPQALLAGYELKYVLTTAGNWHGPIGHYKLTVDKGAADALVSLCAAGIKRSGPTSYSLALENYAPAEDLKILFVAPIPS